MTWKYNDIPFVEPKESYGFIYRIDYYPDEDHPDGSSYIGKKNFYSEVQLPALKSGVVRPESLYRVGRNIKGKRVQFDVIRKSTAWQKYKGSSEFTKNKKILSKTVLALCESKRELTYMECKALFCLDAIEDEKCLNSNILGKFFRGNLI